ncbi:LADA_0D00892g1_1 [Lachancea dasiensis]|uniref:LADA_0D00892g1_1 n=1 Tax=Lachancea dasiensis TaxID=1072105 RepID=A0A1G4J436_9SACH|nr:LADA_0D00892g1_1 [Lachancea dasiensis]
MFGTNSGGTSLFGGAINTSTPASKVVNTDNAFQPRHKSASGGLFGGIGGVAANGVSTPSPSEGLFGNKSNGNAAQSSAKDLFGTGSKPNTTSGTLFGGNGGGGITPGGLFGSKAPQKTPALAPGGLFGSTNGNSNTGGSLFGNSQDSNQNTVSSTGLFGNSNNSTATGINNSGMATSNYGGLFSNKPSTGMGSAGSSTIGGTLSTPASQSSQTQATNPYGIQVSNLPSNVVNMPESITSSLLRKKPQDADQKAYEKPQNFSVSSTNHLPSSNYKTSATLIGKLSSRLKNARSIDPTRGLFSPSRKPLFNLDGKISKNDENNILEQPNKQLINNTMPQLGRNGTKDLRKLKIDTGRIAEKKIKLLNGASRATSVKVLDETNFDSKGEEGAGQSKRQANDSQAVSYGNRTVDTITEKSRVDHGYWCSPSIEQLTKSPVKQLCSVPNFIIGRRGFGAISFDSDVDLSSFVDDLEGNLFGKVVIFHGNRTVEVYPEGLLKPAFGYGLNVPATISLEKIYPTKGQSLELIKEFSAPEVQLLIRKLRAQKGMAFVSYNPTEGLWTFRVQHFSIWGLIEEDDETSQNLEEGQHSGKLAFSNSKPISKVENATAGRLPIQNIVHPGTAETQDTDMLNLIDEKQYEPLDVGPADIKGIEVQTNLSVSSDWILQLKLAGQNHRSIFALEKEKKGSGNLFASLEVDLEQRKDIKRRLRITKVPPFAKFSGDSRLLMTSAHKYSGCVERSVLTYAGDALSKGSNAFESSFHLAEIEARHKNAYPSVTNWAVTIEEIGNLLSNREEDRQLWSLISILFDEIFEDSISSEQVRYQKLCDWVVKSNEKAISDRMSLSTSSNEQIFLHLMSGNIESATKLAIKSRNLHLAPILTLLGGEDNNVTSLAKQQLQKWKSLNRKVEPFVIKTYQLLAGMVFDNEALIDFKNHYSWLECLAIHLLYGKRRAQTLEESVLEFFDTCPLEKKTKAESIINDILNFYSSENGMEELLEKIEISNEASKCRNMWFIMQTLHYKSDLSFSAEKMDRITLQFFEQLVSNSFYVEALFTLIFLKNDELAKREIDILVSRHAQFFYREFSKEKLKKFKVPEGLLFKAMALYYKNIGDHLAEMDNLLKGGFMEEAAKCLYLNVGPELILQSSQDISKLDVLRTMLKRTLDSSPLKLDRTLNLFQDYTHLILDGEVNTPNLEKILHALPTYYKAHSHLKLVSICCSVMSSRVAMAYMEHKKGSITHYVMEERLAELPIGEPERRTMMKRIKRSYSTT